MRGHTQRVQVSSLRSSNPFYCLPLAHLPCGRFLNKRAEGKITCDLCRTALADLEDSRDPVSHLPCTNKQRWEVTEYADFVTVLKQICFTGTSCMEYFTLTPYVCPQISVHWKNTLVTV